MVLTPISRYRVADILLHLILAWRAFRPGLIVGVLRIFCNGLCICTAQRFHTEDNEHTCRVGCTNVNPTLCFITKNVFFVPYV